MPPYYQDNQNDYLNYLLPFLLARLIPAPAAPAAPAKNTTG